MSKLLRDAIRMMSGLLVMALVTLPLSSALAGWQDDWEKLEAAAKKEGKLALSVHSGATLRTAIMKFGAAYPEIKLLVSIDPTRKYIARVRQERKAGVYNIDVRVGGPRTNHRLIPENVYVPIKPALVLPEVLDGSKWLGGFDAGFTDLKKEISYCPTAGVSTLLRVNRDVVSEKEFNKLDDLLDPKWKGKFTMRDPRGIGAGNTMVNILLIAKGEDFVRRFLVDQKPVFSHVDRQVAEWLVRGQYPIATGVGATNIRRFQRQGWVSTSKSSRSRSCSM